MGALSSLASVGLNLALADQAQSRQSRTINAERDQQIREIEQRDAEDQRKAADRLRRQLAAQRARAGAAGLGNSATSNAVLRGLVQEAAEAQQVRRTETSGDIAAINRSGTQREARESPRLGKQDGPKWLFAAKRQQANLPIGSLRHVQED